MNQINPHPTYSKPRTRMSSLKKLTAVAVVPLMALVALAMLFSTLWVNSSAAAPETAVTVATLYVIEDNDGGNSGSACSITVPCTLPRALTLATDGDEIRLAKGTYTSDSDPVLLVSQSITVSGGFNTDNWNTADPVANLTILDAEENGRVVEIDGINNSNTIIQGLSIRNGLTAGSGGGIYVESGATATIRNNRIHNNRANDTTFGGGGIYAGGDVIIHDNHIYDNTSTHGGGIRIGIGSTATDSDITRNRIYNNSATLGSSGHGGGIFIANNSTSFIDSNTIYNNTAWDGGGIATYFGTVVTIQNNILHKNTATTVGANEGGGGIMFRVATATMWNNTIAYNNSGLNGGGVFLNSSTVKISNNTVVSNTTTNTPGSNTGIYHVVSTLNGGYNNTFGNTTNAGVLTNPRSQDPQFANNHTPNLRLSSSSLDIDDGDPILITVTTDIDQQSRPNNVTPDIGADEFHATTPLYNLTPIVTEEYVSRDVGSATFNHQLENIGTQTDNYSFSCSNSHGWTVTTCPSPVTNLAPGGIVDLQTSINVPTNTIPLDTGTTFITATATNSPDVILAAVHTIVAPRPGISFTHKTTSSVFLLPGEIYTVEHTLINLSDANDTFLIELSGDALGWATLIPSNPSEEYLTVDESRVIETRIYVNSTAEAGISDIITVKASSEFSPTISATLINTITAKPTAGNRYVSKAGGAFDANNNCTQSSLPCKTVAHAVSQARTSDTVFVANGTYTEIPINLNAQIQIRGQGATPASVVIQSNGSTRIFNVAAGLTAQPTISNLTLRNGNGVDGGAVYVDTASHIKFISVVFDSNTAANGGAIYANNNAVITLESCTFTGNNSSADGGAIYLNGSTVYMKVSRFETNTAVSNGGAIYVNGATLDGANNLIASNSAAGNGGGIYASGGSLNLQFATITNNDGDTGGGIYANNTNIDIEDTAIVSNTASTQYSSIRAGTPPVFTFDYNAIWPTGSADFTPNGTNTTLTVNPPFDGADYHVLAGNELVDTDTRSDDLVDTETDFEGDFRPSDQGYDIGWDELAGCRAKRGSITYGNIQDAVDVITSTTNFIQVTGICRGATDGATVRLDSSDGISSTMVIQGGWNGNFSARTYETTLIDPEGEGRAFFINGITTTIELLTIVNGDAAGLGGGGGTGTDDAGGAIYVSNGFVTVNDVDIQDSTAVLGGAIYNQAGELRITSFELPFNFNAEGETDRSTISTIDGNSASNNGGGVYNRNGSIIVERAIIHGNTAVNGGGVYLHSGTNQLTNIVLSENEASNDGGGVYLNISSQLWQMTVYSNTATNNGGGLYNALGNSAIKNSIFENNQAATGEAIDVNTSGGTPAVDYNYYFNNNLNGTTGGSNSVMGSTPSGMLSPGSGDYHLTDTSPVLDIGMTPNISITTDFDGEIRPSNQGYDMGADELLGCLARTNDTIYGNIQLALIAAVDGAVIDVAGRCSGIHPYDTGGVLGVISQTVHITKNIHLVGGWDLDFTKQGVVSTTLDAGLSGRVIYIAPAMEVTIENFDIRMGDASSMDGNGGAIYIDHAADVNILNNNIYSNTAVNGAAIYSVDSVTMLDSGNFIHHNDATNGAVYLTHGVGFTATVQNNFFYENNASGDGAAIYSAVGDNTLRHNTVYSNTAMNGGAFYLAADAPDVRNNIFMSNTAVINGGGLAGVATAVVDYNDYFNNTPNATGGSIIIGTNALSFNPQFVDAANGDFTIPFVSPVVDKGDESVDLAHDAMDTIRPSHNGMDIGAYEVGGCYARDVLAPMVIYGSVQEAIDNAQDGSTIEVNGICLGVQERANSGSTLVKQTLYLSKTLTIDGNSWEYDPNNPTGIAIFDPIGRGRALYIDSSLITVTVKNFIFRNGDGDGAGVVNGGGAVYNAGTAVILTSVSMNNNSAANGGAVYNAGELTLSDDSLSYNNATNGGAIYNVSDGFMLIDSTLYTNNADNGGALYNNISVNMPTYTATVKSNTFYSYTVPNNGGAIYQANGRFLIDGNTIYDSSADDNGGAIYLTGGSANSVDVWNNIIYYSVAASGGAIYDNNTNANIWYNTLYQNDANEGLGAGIRSAAASSSIYNNIVDGGAGSNGSAIAIDGTPNVDYNLIRGYLAPYSPGSITPANDIYDDAPHYVDAGENDYHLEYGSAGMDAGLGLPAITAQHDIDDDDRPVNNGVDMGADEINTCHLLVDDQEFHVLQEAIDYAITNGFGQIKMARGVCSGVQENHGIQQVGYISQTLEILGSRSPGSYAPTNDYNGAIGAVSSRIDARGEGRAIFIAPGVAVTFTHMAFVNGDATQAGDSPNGGGIYLSSASSVNLEESPICQNTATNGGGLYAANGSDVLLNGAHAGACRVFIRMSTGPGPSYPIYATFIGNTATTNGGGVYLGGDFLLRNYGLIVNEADNGGGMYADGNGRIINGVFYGNTATGDGAGLYNNGSTEAYHNTIRDNEAAGSGGGIKNSGTLLVNSSILYANSSSDGTDGGINGGGTLRFNLFNSNVPVQTTHGSSPVVDDPLLYGTVYLSVYSPAIDQADSSLVEASNDPFIDYDVYVTHREDGDDNHLGVVRSDIGAVEYFKDFGCRIMPEDPVRTGVSGGTTVYNFSVQNIGWPLPPTLYNHSYTDTITVTLNSGAWPSVLNMPSPIVFTDMGPHETRPFTLTVSVPPTVILGSDNSTVTCTSASRPTRQNSSTATTTVGEDRQVEIGVPQAATLAPGDIITFTHTITNRGNIEDTYEVIPKPGAEGQTIADIVDADGNVTNGITVTLSPGQNITRLLRITVLDNAAADIVDTPGATVQSETDGSVQDAVLDLITILPVPGTRYVSAIGGNDNSNCTDAGSPCATVQWAIDQAMDDDAILVAAGDYTTAVTATVNLQTITQTLFINKSLAIVGGYSRDDGFATQQTITNAVTLSGEDSRRVVYITNGNTVMLGGLFLQDGYSADNGGGIYNDGSDLVITSTLLISNSSDIDGGGLYHTSGNLTLQSVVVANNNSTGDGAGIYVAAAGTGDLENNTFASNSTASDGGAGYLAGGTFTFRNNIIDGNTATTNSGVHVAGGTLTANEFNLYNNNSPAISVTGSNFKADPDFIDGYYHISPTSPAKDAGTQAVTYLLGVDIDGNRRKQGDNIDIGADEVTQTPKFEFAPELLTGSLPIAGGTYTYTHILTNTSTFIDGYIFNSSEYDPLGGSWVVDITTNPVDTTAIGMGGHVTVTAVVAIGSGFEGHQNHIVITATSTTDDFINDYVENITTVEQDTPGVEIYLWQDVLAARGTTVNFSHTIANTGTGANAYTLSQLTAVPPGWDATIAPSGDIWLESGATAPFTVTVTVPPAATLGDNFTALIEAESIDLAVSDQLTDTVTVFEDTGSDISIFPEADALIITPGETAVYTHTITNNGSSDENITFFNTDPPEYWEVTVEPSSITYLPPSGSRDVVISVKSPLDAGNSVVPITITADASGGDSVQAVDTTTTEEPTGIALVPAAHTSLITPGTMRTYTHTLKNWDDAPATIVLTHTDTTAPPIVTFAVQVSPLVVNLAAGGTAEITVDVTAPTTGFTGIVHTVDITATSSLADAIATAVDTSVIGFNIALTPDEQLKIAPAGTVLTFTHTFTNINGPGASFDVTADSPLGWLTDYNPKSIIALASEDPQDIVVTMTIPSGIPAGIEDATELVVTWQGNAVLSETAVDRARTPQTHSLSFTQPEAQDALQNSPVVYTHTLRNGGNGPDNYEITAVSSNGWTIDPIASVMNLPAGSSTTVSVVLNVPSVPLGTVDEMTVTAMSTIDNSSTADLMDTTTITNSVGGSSTIYLPIILNNYSPPVTGLSINPEAAAQTKLEGTTAVYNHTVTNDGNSPEDVTMSFVDNRGWTDSVVPTNFTLAAGASTTVVVTVNVPASTDGLVDVATVTATGNSGETAVAIDTTTSSSTPVTPTPTTPTPTPCIFTPPATGNPSGVDLLVTNVTLSPANPVTGQQVVVNVTIKNQGQADMVYDNGFYLDFYVNPSPEPPGEDQPGNLWWGIQSTDFPAGVSRTYSDIHIFNSSGNMRIWAQVDTDNFVIEANKNNNLWGCKAVTVTGTAINVETTPASQSDNNTPRLTPTPFMPLAMPVQTATPEPVWLVTATPFPVLPPQSND